MLPLLEPWAPCPCCLSTAPRALHIQRDKKSPLVGPFYALLGCERCGVVYVSPRPSEEALNRFYSSDDGDGWWRTLEEVQQKREAKRAAARRELAPVLDRPVGSAVDIGCGSGETLDVLQDAGWQTTGIEPHMVSRAAAAERHRMIDALPATPEFDGIVIHHVLEHVLRPYDLLRSAWAAAKPGAWICLGVPMFEEVGVTGNLKRACGPVHLNGFTRDALENALRVTGWKVMHPEAAPSIKHRNLAYGMRDVPAEPTADPLRPAIDALRAYGRGLDKEGDFVGPAPTVQNATS